MKNGVRISLGGKVLGKRNNEAPSGCKHKMLFFSEDFYVKHQKQDNFSKLGLLGGASTPDVTVFCKLQLLQVYSFCFFVFFSTAAFQEFR